MRQQGDSAAALDDGAALFRECPAPPSLGKGLEKVAQTKLASPRSCQLIAAGWTSTSAVEKLRQTKPDGKLRQTLKSKLSRDSHIHRSLNHPDSSLVSCRCIHSNRKLLFTSLDGLFCILWSSICFSIFISIWYISL